MDNPAARNWHLDVTSTKPSGVTNQDFINRAAFGRQPGPEEHDPRNVVLTSAKLVEERKHAPSMTLDGYACPARDRPSRMRSSLPSTHEQACWPSSFFHLR
jgi:hypothetical protein